MPSLKRIVSAVQALRLLCFVLLGFGAPCVTAADASRLVLAHYMPWYASKPVSGVWGWHWTMGHFDPEQTSANGQREAASHDYPLIGLYDSGDPAALECQVLQMKFAGIYGVIIDWYGTKDFNDYALIQRNTEKLIPFIKKAGLKFAICYEDQSVGQMVKGGALKSEEALRHAKSVFQWLDQHWFSDDAYVKVDGRPVLLVFGPQYFEGAQWKELCSGLTKKPLLHTLPHLSEKSGADGFFIWPPVTGGKSVPQKEWRGRIHYLLARGDKGESVIAGAFPGFHDIYKEAALHDSYGYIDDRDGKTFEETLDMALESKSRFIQIATWNDYGEGTTIEPTRRFGYRYLEIVQKRMQPRGNAASSFTSEDLRLPARLYELRKNHTGDAKRAVGLDRISGLLFASRCREARQALELLR